MYRRFKAIRSAVAFAFVVVAALAAYAPSASAAPAFGAYIGQGTISQFEQGAGSLDHVMTYIDSRDTWVNSNFLSSIGTRTPLLTVEFWNDSLSSVANGSLDSKIAAEANRARTYGRPIVLRPFHEFNGNWYPWFVTGTNAGTFKAAWQRIVNGFRNAGATNVKFMFSPNNDSSSGAASMSTAWPGSSYVDIIGADGYSWAGSYRTFQQAFQGIYNTLTGLHSTAPFWVGESAAGYQTGRQADYANSIFSAAPQFPRLAAFTWFAVDKEEQWYPRSATFTAIRNGRSTGTPPAQCADGQDNDGDGLVDLNDPGCSGSSDNDEMNSTPPPTGSDLALNRPASASSTENGLTSLRPALANDGSSTTRWSSNYSVPQWWQVDLGSSRSISRVELNWEVAYASQYQIQTRNTTSEGWSTAATISNTSAGLKSHSFTARNARYVRVYVTAKGTQWGVSLWDARVFGS